MAFMKWSNLTHKGFADADSNIIALSNTLNETSDILNEQISNLRETLQQTTNVIGDAVNSLKENMSRQIVKLNDTSAELQQIADSVAIIMDNYKKIMDSLQPAPN